MLRSEINYSEVSASKSDNVAKKVVFKILEKLQGVGLILIEKEGNTYHVGDQSADLQAQLMINHPGFYKRILTGGSIAAGEAYVDGWWDSPDLTKVVQVLARNLPILDKLEAKVGWMTALAEKISHKIRRNNKDNARENISAHYDLGNALYSLFLDSKMLYSCAIYRSEQDDLLTAQTHKMDRLCRQLDLKPTDHLLEIGTGWGALATHAAKHYGCRVTTTTISKEQYDWAKECVEQQGLGDKITLLLDDYRDLTGQYDKVVSVEMVEAVGKEYLTTYIKKCQSLLKPGGLLALQTITITDQRYDSYSRGVDFIQKHIFPGGFLPSVTVLVNEMTKQSDFVVRDIKDIGLDYARTLSDWHKAFNQNTDKLAQLGYDQRFVRMWRYYFCYCEGGFLERSISTVQLIASRPK
ncbi:class I SAM-dependent methyltransferase [Photobacterium profundum]|uniref:Cyclopropane-fatty-acyl-phospholipid synthase n=1 Tax=Photobacterium profundum 3TCK TaxID=314280 RepID=Q1Z6L4_9GAMM|nr:cyclopropane-fatty-acyl-phospholipid synthase family protein [Photobacterium profundum]EAS44133.1 cyclopropane-fatty-acyl-phospholipid synthase [Photobacterium profundum 3TCK]PSV59862.1 class I SAM-dependent methyltransferase [Photobacterium profundum]